MFSQSQNTGAHPATIVLSERQAAYLDASASRTR